VDECKPLVSGEGIILWANQTELDVLGYTAEEVGARGRGGLGAQGGVQSAGAAGALCVCWCVPGPRGIDTR